MNVALDATEEGTLNALLKVLDANAVGVEPIAARRMGTHTFLLFATRMADVEALRKRVAAMPGVARVENVFFRSADERSDWIDEAVDARLAEADVSTGTSSPRPRATRRGRSRRA